jgi:hypothetical protein
VYRAEPDGAGEECPRLHTCTSVHHEERSLVVEPIVEFFVPECVHEDIVGVRRNTNILHLEEDTFDRCQILLGVTPFFALRMG